MVSVEKWAQILLRITCIWGVVSIAVFKVHSLSLTFDNLIMMCLGGDL